MRRLFRPWPLALERIAALLVLGYAALHARRLVEAIWAFDTDDAFITLRYARHLVEGHGIVWNPGEAPVEGYSNFSSLLLAATSLGAGYDPLITLKVVNVVAMALSSVLAYVLARTFVGPLAATLPALALASFSGQALWAVSGLETSLYQALVLSAVVAASYGLGFSALTSPAFTGSRASVRTGPLIVAALACVLAGLSRPEGPFVFVCITLALALRFWGVVHESEYRIDARARAIARAGLVFVATFALLYGAYFAWRVSYFGRLWPNTVYCKTAYLGDPWSILRGFFARWYVVIGLALLTPWRRLDARYAMLLGVPALYVVALYGADPIVAHHDRLLLPAIPLLLIAASVVVGDVVTRLATPIAFGWELVPVALAVALLAWAAPGTQAELSAFRHQYDVRSEGRAQLARQLERTVPESGTIVIGDVGVVGYESKQRILDAFCLNSREMTSPPIDMSAIAYARWVLAQKPDAIVVHSGLRDQLVPRTEYGFYAAMLENPEFWATYRKHDTPTAGGDGFYYVLFRRVREGEHPR